MNYKLTQQQLLSFSAAGGNELRIVSNKIVKTDFLQERHRLLILYRNAFQISLNSIYIKSKIFNRFIPTKINCFDLNSVLA
jgi:hypothetical protein